MDIWQDTGKHFEILSTVGQNDVRKFNLIRSFDTSGPWRYFHGRTVHRRNDSDHYCSGGARWECVGLLHRYTEQETTDNHKFLHPGTGSGRHSRFHSKHARDRSGPVCRKMAFGLYVLFGVWLH